MNAIQIRKVALFTLPLFLASCQSLMTNKAQITTHQLLTGKITGGVATGPAVFERYETVKPGQHLYYRFRASEPIEYAVVEGGKVTNQGRGVEAAGQVAAGDKDVRTVFRFSSYAEHPVSVKMGVGNYKITDSDFKE